MPAKALIFLLSILSFSISSCSKKSADLKEDEKDNDTMVRMQPYDLTKERLKNDYLAEKKVQVERFVAHNWRHESESLSFLVARNGQIIYEHYQGDADKKKKTKIEADTPLHIASVSKVITATAVLELIDAGKIALDQKVNTILTDFPYPEITIKTLLNHRSGLRNYAYYFDDPKHWDKRKPLQNLDILELFKKNEVPLDFVTDRKFAYNNTNYAMLALIIEKVTGLSYAEAMKEMVFKPLGMANTFVFEYEKHKDKIVPSYKGNMEIGLDFLDAIYGDKNIYSTPRDMLKFDSARYNPDFLTPELQKQVYVGYSYEHKGEKNYGLGIRIIEWVTGQHFYFHNGWWHGNTSAYVNLKNEKVMILALSNRYSQKTYRVRFLAKLFGDYPFKIEKDAGLQ